MQAVEQLDKNSQKHTRILRLYFIDGPGPSSAVSLRRHVDATLLGDLR